MPRDRSSHAIALALEIHADLLLIDDREAVRAARSAFKVTGTLDEDPVNRSLLALGTLNLPPSLLETLSRQEVRFDRQYHRAADRLARLKLKKIDSIPLTD